jgi:hypothetical protein
MTRLLTDEQLWVILNELDTHYTELGPRLNTSLEAVRLAQYRMKRNGWSCKIRYGTCRYCGKPMTVRVRSHAYAYHRECKPVATSMLKRQRESAAEVEERTEYFRNWLLRSQEQSKATATKYRAPWTEEDDQVVLEMMEKPVEESCQILRRTAYGIIARRHRLRKKMAKLAEDSDIQPVSEPVLRQDAENPD